MADDRAVEDITATVARLQAEINDLRSTAMVRAQMGMTGDIEPTFRSTPKVGTFFLLGGSAVRADFPALWQWVQDQGLVIPGLFTVGNGSTTFGIPDFRGRIPIGVGTLGANTYALGGTGGNASIQQAITQMARHSHTGGTGTDSHQHSSTGSHGGHFNGRIDPVPAGNTGAQDVWMASGSVSGGDHQHASDTHSHTIPLDGGSSGSAGPGDAMDIRPPYLAINWMIWT
jgi:microcystin-dependent protein